MAVVIAADLGGISNFDIHGDPTTVGVRWKKWKRSFELLVVGKGVQKVAQNKALLLRCGGLQMQDVYYTFPEAREPGDGTHKQRNNSINIQAPSQCPLRQTSFLGYGSVAC